jgi:hypothetical protein
MLAAASAPALADTTPGLNPAAQVVLTQADLPAFSPDPNSSHNGDPVPLCSQGNTLIGGLGSSPNAVDGADFRQASTNSQGSANNFLLIQSSALGADTVDQAHAAFTVLASAAFLSCIAQQAQQDYNSESFSVTLTPQPSHSSSTGDESTDLRLNVAGTWPDGEPLTAVLDFTVIRIQKMIAILVVSPWAVTGQDQPFPDGEVKLLDGLLASRMTAVQGLPNCPPQNPPRVVVVMVMGLNSELNSPAGNSYNPLKESQCSDALTHITNPALKSLQDTFGTTGPGSGQGPTLLTAIAQTGALILPYSYLGACFLDASKTGCDETPADGQTSPPTFHVTPYTKAAPNQADIIYEDWVLDSELVSIRRQWPETKIILIGHSEGGLIVKQWWRDWDGHHGHAADHASTNWNVAGVFSVDGPINGGSNALEFLEFTQPAGTCPLLPKLGSMLPCATLAQQFSALWYDYALSQQDDTVMAQSAVGDRAIYTPIGTRGDLVMEVLSMSKKLFNVEGEELGPQLLAQFDGDGQINTLLVPGRLTPTITSSTQGLDSHGVVYRDPGNIAFLADAVRAAMGARPDARPVAFTRLTMPAGPAARLSAPAAGPGGSVTITGTSLGAQSGAVALMANASSVPTPLEITDWADGKVVASLPAGASSGLVVGTTATGDSFVAGLLTVVGVGGPVAKIQVVQPTANVIDGHPTMLTVTGVDVADQPVVGAPVTVSDGLSQATLTTDRSGKAEFPVTGYGQQHLVVYSGGTWNPLEIDHAQPRTESLSLSVTPGRAPAGSPITLNATVTDGQGHPLAGVPVWFQAVGPSQPVLAATSVQTDQQGHAQTSITAATEGGAVVTAAGNSPLTEDGANVGWDKNQPQSQIIPLTLTALLVVLIGLALLLVRRRRHGA